ncbi:MAG: dihydrodipicolinate reductase C-terminal domain-containing protein [Sediminibacterium sp.]
MMKVGLVGFGKTGKAVASVILQHASFSLEWVFRKRKLQENMSAAEILGIESGDPGKVFSNTTITAADLLNRYPVDCIIDFSDASGIYIYGREAADRGIKIISAISHYADAEKSCLKKLSAKTLVFWSPNITLGVNYLLYAAKLLKKIAPWVDIQIVEEHFKGKQGVSGTAVKIAEALSLEDSEINSVRAGGIVGRHEVIFGFPFQTVRLIHESISREAFGNGVVFVAENIRNKKEGLYNFDDILLPYFTTR